MMRADDLKAALKAGTLCFAARLVRAGGSVSDVYDDRYSLPLLHPVQVLEVDVEWEQKIHHGWPYTERKTRRNGVRVESYDADGNRTFVGVIEPRAIRGPWAAYERALARQEEGRKRREAERADARNVAAAIGGAVRGVHIELTAAHAAAIVDQLTPQQCAALGLPVPLPEEADDGAR